MLVAEIGAEGWVVIVGAVFLGLSTLTTQILTLVLAHFKDKAKLERDRVVAQKVEAVKAETKVANKKQDDRAEVQDRKLDDIHHLVNKPLATALKAVALAYRERADRPEATESDQLAAASAEADYRDHEQKQAKVDEASTRKLNEEKGSE